MFCISGLETSAISLKISFIGSYVNLIFVSIILKEFFISSNSCNLYKYFFDIIATFALSCDSYGCPDGNMTSLIARHLAKSLVHMALKSLRWSGSKLRLKAQ